MGVTKYLLAGMILQAVNLPPPLDKAGYFLEGVYT